MAIKHNNIHMYMYNNVMNNYRIFIINVFLSHKNKSHLCTQMNKSAIKKNKHLQVMFAHVTKCFNYHFLFHK